MPRKKTPEKPIAKDDPSRILPMTMEEVMHNSMMPYAEHVILERALPRVEDGLKPVQRRILYTMMELGNTPDKPHRKCARIVGDCLGKYHPHGDTSVYDALVRMAQDFTMRAPMVDGHGNFGSIDGDGAAAMRYTEARMTNLAMLMLRDIEKDTVSFSLNFDDSLKEPDVLPARFPNLLVNGASGIAVGLATNIPPHNLKEAINGTIAVIDNPDISLDDLMQIIPGPDFPTGGVLVNNEEIRLGYETGRSKLSLRARVHIEDGTNGRKLIVITEIPYQVNKAQMLAKIQQLSEEKKQQLGGIYEIRDESDRSGLRAVIELKRDVDPQKTLAYLYKYSDLQVTFGVNMVAIADGKPVQMGLKSMIEYFIRHQKDVVTRRTQYELHQAEVRAHILEGLMIAVDNLDEVIRLIRASKTPKEAREALMAAFDLDEAQAQAILDMRLQRLTNLEILALRKEFEDLQKLIHRLQGILASEKKLMKVIRDELSEIIQEYGDDRRTTIEDAEEIKIDPAEEKAPADEVVLALTRAGQLKRMQPQLYRRIGLPSSQEDYRESAVFTFNTKTDETLYIFTNLGNCFTLKVGSINECKPRDRGQQLAGILQGLGENEIPLYLMCLPAPSIAAQPDLVFITRNGKIKRLICADLDIRSRKFTCFVVKGDDELVSVFPAPTRDDLLIISKKAMSIRLKLEDIPIQGRISGGVNGMQIAVDDQVIFACQLFSPSSLILFTERGWAKCIPDLGFEPQGRSGKGTRCFAMAKTGTTGRSLAGVCQVPAGMWDIIVHQAKSPASVVPVSEVSIQTLSGKGFMLVDALFEDIVTSIDLQPASSAGV